jgi:hypothetical protein
MSYNKIGKKNLNFFDHVMIGALLIVLLPCSPVILICYGAGLLVDKTCEIFKI